VGQPVRVQIPPCAVFSEGLVMQVTKKEIEDAVDLVECLVMDNETTFKDIDQLEGKVEGLKEYVESLIEQVTILTRKVEQLENRLE